ncbi:hypothetical protein [Alloyangia pacifica]|uniref:hypothetical protein n=1 Tax=Alloyangia pacifica TaxID=311180 RepID=UPI001CD2B23C|nr:hypothetical protein [Alloyangia pacifica]MCA0994873.1 hypothetical protein [Alloyangia pacifica]
MRSLLTYPLALILAGLLALTSATSAAMMAPDRGSAALEALELTVGMLHGDGCGSGGAHEHHCPFCHGLPNAPVLSRHDCSQLLVPHESWRQGADLLREAQARNINHSPRAPPVAL